jgi:hypothetical protein
MIIMIIVIITSCHETHILFFFLSFFLSFFCRRNKVSITISSDEVGVFELQGKFLGVQVDAMEVRLDDLLQKQFDNVQVMTLFGTAKVNVNLLTYLLNKKFYV